MRAVKKRSTGVRAGRPPAFSQVHRLLVLARPSNLSLNVLRSYSPVRLNVHFARCNHGIDLHLRMSDLHEPYYKQAWRCAFWPVLSPWPNVRGTKTDPRHQWYNRKSASSRHGILNRSSAVFNSLSDSARNKDPRGPYISTVYPLQLLAADPGLPLCTRNQSLATCHFPASCFDLPARTVICSCSTTISMAITDNKLVANDVATVSHPRKLSNVWYLTHSRS